MVKVIHTSGKRKTAIARALISEIAQDRFRRLRFFLADVRVIFRDILDDYFGFRNVAPCRREAEPNAHAQLHVAAVAEVGDSVLGQQLIGDS